MSTRSAQAISSRRAVMLQYLIQDRSSQKYRRAQQVRALARCRAVLGRDEHGVGMG
ncbi:hypothetical protein [Streptomyces sp. NBC_01530]|uniref:hypothetical protein n=1 Tax=Streptomyces sp. NBC_01530 TaxID=2903895 RepID=UPI00386B005D